MKQIQIMSRHRAKHYSALQYIPTSLIISIHSVYGLPNRFFKNPQIKYVKHWEFDDVEVDENGITQAQANEIVEFVKAHEEDVESIVVHCDAGISRSSGIAAAISYWKFGDDKQIFGDKRYSPNMRCYIFMLKAFGYEMTPEFKEEIDTKLQLNIQTLKREYDF